MKNIFNKKLKVMILLCLLAGLLFPLAGCRQYDKELDVAYFFKTDPEKTALDFVYALDNHDPEYIYSNLLLDSDRQNISRDKFLREMNDILSDVESISVTRVVYLGYEEDMSKVVIEFEVKYKNGQSSQYKKYLYFRMENNRWKMVFDKTFI